MKLSFNNLLAALAQEYNTLVLHNDVPNIKKSNVRKRKYMYTDPDVIDEDELDDDLYAIEEEMMCVMHLLKKKNPIPSTIQFTRKGQKRGPYDKKIKYFTDPYTGERSVMTFMHSVWFQSYILNPDPSNKKWDKKFRNRFRLPYKSFLELVDMWPKRLKTNLMFCRIFLKQIHNYIL